MARYPVPFGPAAWPGGQNSTASDDYVAAQPQLCHIPGQPSGYKWTRNVGCTFTVPRFDPTGKNQWTGDANVLVMPDSTLCMDETKKGNKYNAYNSAGAQQQYFGQNDATVQYAYPQSTFSYKVDQCPTVWSVNNWDGRQDGYDAAGAPPVFPPK